MRDDPSFSSSTGPPQPAAGRRLGLPLWAVVGLALLSVPRIFAHDLGLGGGPIPALLTVGPVVVWVVVVLAARVPSPWVTLLAVGVLYGVALGVVHNVLWDEVFADDPPGLGALDPERAELPLRVAAFVSSVFTGTAVGLVAGLVATGLRALAGRWRR
ncbi:hypothetical protein [Nocardioides sp. TF02-7]|uniref:hypothetical protein n=1 Tax=Nocardioides sp. TF02-7 TaxID=2917724 RepID=UPI001F05567F|nr:hypothetical protein [Nocardioides sp. TF02-7]UMG91856.1 hypothetical protein MF408_17695 [Nocardioides sp. TF02-7]